MSLASFLFILVSFHSRSAGLILPYHRSLSAGLLPGTLPTCLISSNCPSHLYFSSLSLLFIIFSLISPPLPPPPLLTRISSFIFPSPLLFPVTPPPPPPPPRSPRCPTMAAGVPGVPGVRAPERAEGGCSSPSVCATTRRRGTTGATAPGRGRSTGPAASRCVPPPVSSPA